MIETENEYKRKRELDEMIQPALLDSWDSFHVQAAPEASEAAETELNDLQQKLSCTLLESLQLQDQFEAKQKELDAREQELLETRLSYGELWVHEQVSLFRCFSFFPFYLWLLCVCV